MTDRQHHRARARYAFMLGLPSSFTLDALHEEAEQYEECRYGRSHEAWRYGYFGLPFPYGYASKVEEGRDAARRDCCPMVPPGMSVDAAQRDWKQFDAYFLGEKESNNG